MKPLITRALDNLDGGCQAWMCRGRGVVGYGSTPKGAYLRWSEFIERWNRIKGIDPDYE